MSHVATAMKRGYRADIDGLRAIAVLAVVVFHLNRDLLPGGFVGVDVFFVISGFLITRNIVSEIDADRFTIAEFYRRRIKRITPAALFVAGITVVVSQLLFLPNDARQAAKSGFWSVMSLANVHFWRDFDTGYFAADSAASPLLHYWSLGVEEQFYVVWPLFLIWAYRARNLHRVAWLTAAVSIVSFGLAYVLTPIDPSFAYYMLPTRAGELLVGGLLAFAFLKKDPDEKSSLIASLAGVAGLVLVAASCFMITEADPFPGWRAIVPTVGTALLLVAGSTGANGVSRLLAVKPLVWTGLISYSAYLWHWPILAFYHYGYGDPGLVASVGLLTATVVLSIMTYKWVEQPMRHTKAPLWTVFWKQYALPGGVIVTLCMAAIYPERTGIHLTSADYRESVEAIASETQPAYQEDWVCQRDLLQPEDLLQPTCALGSENASAEGALLFGDSNAAHYIPMVETFAMQAGFRFRNAAISSCPPIDPALGVFSAQRVRERCRASLETAWPWIQTFPVVFLGANWVNYAGFDAEFMDRLEETLLGMSGRGQQIVILGKVATIDGFDRLCRAKSIRYPGLTCVESASELDPALAQVNQRLARFAEATADVSYFDPNPILCAEGPCRASDESGRLLYFDFSHLSIYGSLQLGETILAREGVPIPFRIGD